VVEEHAVLELAGIAQHAASPTMTFSRM